MKKILTLLKKDLVKVSIYSSISTLIGILTKLIVNKVLAVLVGPSGIALLGQLTNLISMVNPLSSGGILSGVTKYIAQYKDDKIIVRKYISNSIYITLIFTAFTALLLIIFSKQLARKVLFNEEYRIIIIILSIFLILFSLNSLVLSIINGFKQFKLFIRLNIVSSISGLILMVLLTYYFKVFGALLALVSYQSFVFLFTLIYLKNSTWFRIDYFRGKFDLDIWKKLSSFSMMTLVSAFTLPLSQLLIRNNINHNLSINDAGYWESMNRISSLYLMFFTTSISTYYLPRLSEIKTIHELKREIYGTYKIVIPLLIAAAFGLFILKDFIINTLFSKEFISIRELFKFQLIGDVFKIASWLLTYVMLAKAMTKEFIFTEILFTATYITFTLLGIQYFGLRGTTYAYALNYLLLFITLVFLFKLKFLKDEQ